MTMSYAEASEIKDGRMPDFLAGIRELHQLIRDVHPPTRSTCWRAIVDGPVTGFVTHGAVLNDADDLAALDADSAVQAAIENLTGSGGPATLHGRVTQRVVAEAGRPDGEISWTVHGKIGPNGVREAESLIDEINSTVLSVGALGIRYLQTIEDQGPGDDVVAVSFYRDLPHWCAVVRSLGDDPEWQRLYAQIAGSNGPVETIHTQLWLRIL